MGANIGSKYGKNIRKSKELHPVVGAAFDRPHNTEVTLYFAARFSMFGPYLGTIWGIYVNSLSKGTPRRVFWPLSKIGAFVCVAF